MGLPKPDIVLFLNIDPKLALARKDYGREIFENEEFQQKVFHSYMKLSTSMKSNDPESWKVSRTLKSFL
jgi:dTMP kinase